MSWLSSVTCVVLRRCRTDTKRTCISAYIRVIRTNRKKDAYCVYNRVFAQQISHLEISRALDFFLGNYRNLRRLFEISAGFGKSEQEISNLPSHSRIIWGG